jgi:hypothetical protein
MQGDNPERTPLLTIAQRTGGIQGIINHMKNTFQNRHNSKPQILLITPSLGNGTNS